MYYHISQCKQAIMFGHMVKVRDKDIKMLIWASSCLGQSHRVCDAVILTWSVQCGAPCQWPVVPGRGSGWFQPTVRG